MEFLIREMEHVERQTLSLNRSGGSGTSKVVTNCVTDSMKTYLACNVEGFVTNCTLGSVKTLSPPSPKEATQSGGSPASKRQWKPCLTTWTE